jgi:hypothetical protein
MPDVFGDSRTWRGPRRRATDGAMDLVARESGQAQRHRAVGRPPRNPTRKYLFGRQASCRRSFDRRLPRPFDGVQEFQAVTYTRSESVNGRNRGGRGPRRDRH